MFSKLWKDIGDFCAKKKSWYKGKIKTLDLE